METEGKYTFAQLNLPEAELKVKSEDGMLKVYDKCRKKYVKMTPEEHVRQVFLCYMSSVLGYPEGLTAVEHLVVINGLKQRADIVVYDKKMNPHLIVECKAPHVPITKEVFMQALRYNTRLGVRYVIVTNGMKHYCAEIKSDGTMQMMAEMPHWKA